MARLNLLPSKEDPALTNTTSGLFNSIPHVTQERWSTKITNTGKCELSILGQPAVFGADFWLNVPRVLLAKSQIHPRAIWEASSDSVSHRLIDEGLAASAALISKARTCSWWALIDAEPTNAVLS